jgi:hypothetical protein
MENYGSQTIQTFLCTNNRLRGNHCIDYKIMLNHLQQHRHSSQESVFASTLRSETLYIIKLK